MPLTLSTGARDRRVVEGVAVMSKRLLEGDIPDLFDGCEVVALSRPMPLDVRRPDVSSLPAEVVSELCAWCGVDRAGSCGACSDLRAVKR